MMKATKAEMRSTVSAIRSELKETIRIMRTATEPVRAELDETTACHEATRTESDPGTMQSVEEHQEIPKEDAAVKPVKGRKKRRRGRKLTAGRPGELNELTRSDYGSGKKLAAACRKMTRRAAVARRKRNVFRKTGTQGNCGPRKRLTAAGIKMTRRARVAWPMENFVRKDWTRNQAEQETPKRRNDGKRLWKGLE
jgi:hypothetical protein